MRLVESVFQIIAPYACVGCGEEGVILCADCLARGSRPLPPRCAGCLRLTDDSQVCQACRPKLVARHVWVGRTYEGVVKEALWAYKFSRKRQAAPVLAHLMSESVPRLPAGTIVTFIPTATTRVRQRSYDQAELLAKQFAILRRLPHMRLLLRSNQTRQVGSSRQQRFEQLAGAFWVLNRHAVEGRSILIIDDIVTTGATIAHAARVLKNAGAASVSAAVVASGK